MLRQLKGQADGKTFAVLFFMFHQKIFIKFAENLILFLTKVSVYDIIIFVSDQDEEEIPVPIPNTEVKLFGADDTGD